MDIDLASLSSRVASLDDALRPIAKSTAVDLSPGWQQRWEPPVDRAGVRHDAEAVRDEILVAYASGDGALREVLRMLLEQNSSFRWAMPAAMKPDTAAGFRHRLMLHSVRDDAREPRDFLDSLADACRSAHNAGVTLSPILQEVAALSSDKDRGKGSTRSLMLTAVGRWGE